MKFRTSALSSVTLSLALIVAAFGCDRANAPEHASSAPTPGSATAPAASAAVPAPIDGTEARRLVADGAFLLDVRSSGEFASGHAEGATNIPVGELAGRLTELPRNRVIITYCASGGRSRAAAATLRADHFDVRDLRTLSAWNEGQ